MCAGCQRFIHGFKVNCCCCDNWWVTSSLGLHSAVSSGEWLKPLCLKEKMLWFLRLVCLYPIFSSVKIQQHGAWLSPPLSFSYWLHISILLWGRWEHPISTAVETMRKGKCRLEVSWSFSPSISPMPCMRLGLLFLLILPVLIHLSSPLT